MHKPRSLGLGNSFSEMTPKHQKHKWQKKTEKYQNYKILCFKGYNQNSEKKNRMKENIFKSYKRFTSRINEELLQFNKKG